MLRPISRHCQLAVLFIALCMNSNAFAEFGACTGDRKAEAGDAVAGSYHFGWDGIYQAYLEYGVCDDGYVAASFSDGVVRLLALDWHSLPKLQELADRDEAFLEFVVRHTDASVEPRHLRQVLSNTEECEEGYRGLCLEIRTAAEFAWEMMVEDFPELGQ